MDSFMTLKKIMDNQFIKDIFMEYLQYKCVPLLILEASGTELQIDPEHMNFTC